MFEYLNDVEEMLHGEDCDRIQDLIDISDTRVNGHTNHYEQLMSKVSGMNTDATDAMNSLSQQLDKPFKSTASNIK